MLLNDELRHSARPELEHDSLSSRVSTYVEPNSPNLGYALALGPLEPYEDGTSMTARYYKIDRKQRKLADSPIDMTIKFSGKSTGILDQCFETSEEVQVGDIGNVLHLLDIAGQRKKDEDSNPLDSRTMFVISQQHIGDLALISTAKPNQNIYSLQIMEQLRALFEQHKTSNKVDSSPDGAELLSLKVVLTDGEETYLAIAYRDEEYTVSVLRGFDPGKLVREYYNSTQNILDAGAAIEENSDYWPKRNFLITDRVDSATLQAMEAEDVVISTYDDLVLVESAITQNQSLDPGHTGMMLFSIAAAQIWAKFSEPEQFSSDWWREE